MGRLKMSGENNANLRRLMKEQAIAQEIGKVLPQFFTNPELLSQNKFDEWKHTNMPPQIFNCVLYGKLRSLLDGSRAWGWIVEYTLRGLQGINGERAKMGIQAVSNLAGGGPKTRIMKRRGFIDRRLRGKSEFEEVSDGQE